MKLYLVWGKATMLLYEKLFEMLSAEIPQTLLSSVDLNFMVLKFGDVGRRDSEWSI